MPVKLKGATIRPMVVEDVDAVRRVEAAAFGARQKDAGNRREKLQLRTRSNVLASRERDPDGCFVAEQSGRLVGFIFSRTWGSVGWFGTFAVLPELQGRGIGKQLIAASVAYLRRQPDRTIGLETLPSIPSGLGLYLKQSFQVRLLTLQLSKKLVPSVPGKTPLLCWSAVDVETRDRWLTGLRQATDCIRPGLDYSKEITSFSRYRSGDTLFLIEGEQVVGASTVRLTSIREGKGDERAVVSPLALHPAHASEDSLQTLLEASEALAHAHGKEKIVVHANARHARALELLLRDGYCVERGLVRMVLTGTDKGPTTDNQVNFARWAG